MGPKRGHIGSPPSEPERTVRRSRAAVMHGPSFRVSYCNLSISVTNGALAASASTRFAPSRSRNSVTPAPCAPGIARVAKVAT